jgi:hypothetical protein
LLPLLLLSKESPPRLARSGPLGYASFVSYFLGAVLRPSSSSTRSLPFRFGRSSRSHDRASSRCGNLTASLHRDAIAAVFDSLSTSSEKARSHSACRRNLGIRKAPLSDDWALRGLDRISDWFEARYRSGADGYAVRFSDKLRAPLDLCAAATVSLTADPAGSHRHTSLATLIGRCTGAPVVRSAGLEPHRGPEYRSPSRHRGTCRSGNFLPNTPMAALGFRSPVDPKSCRASSLHQIS